MIVVVAIVFFSKVPEWQWQYDHALDFLYLIATYQVRLYIFFQRAFAAPLFGPFFNLAAPFLGFPLYMAHPDLVPPHQAQPSVIPPHPVQPESSESDPSEMMDSSFLLHHPRWWLRTKWPQVHRPHAEQIPFLGVHLVELSDPEDRSIV